MVCNVWVENYTFHWVSFWESFHSVCVCVLNVRGLLKKMVVVVMLVCSMFVLNHSFICLMTMSDEENDDVLVVMLQIGIFSNGYLFSFPNCARKSDSVTDLDALKIFKDLSQGFCIPKTKYIVGI